MQLVAAGEVVDEVAGEQPAEPRRHGRADDQRDAVGAGRIIELEQLADVARAPLVDTTWRRPAMGDGQLGVRPGGGQHDDVGGDVGLDDVMGRGDAAQAVGDHAVADHPDRVIAGRHSSRSSIGCQPPCWGGVPPRPRKRNAPAIAPASERATRARRSSFTWG